MSISHSENANHRAALQAAEMTRQSAVAAAGSQAAVKAAEITFYRTARASAIANGLSPTPFTYALLELGTGGS